MTKLIHLIFYKFELAKLMLCSQNVISQSLKFYSKYIVHIFNIGTFLIIVIVLPYIHYGGNDKNSYIQATIMNNIVICLVKRFSVQ
jgi:hypothetical protein